jgi:hypothetical protein
MIRLASSSRAPRCRQLLDNRKARPRTFQAGNHCSNYCKSACQDDQLEGIIRRLHVFAPVTYKSLTTRCCWALSLSPLPTTQRIMRAFILSALLVAPAILASPLTGRQTESSGVTFRFLGGAYCLVPTVADVNWGPCSDPDGRVLLSYTENNGQTALIEVEGHAINATIVPAYGGYVNFYVVSEH